MARLTAVVAAALVPMLAHVARAGDDPLEQVDFSVPRSAAFAFLDTSPTQISEPGTAKDFGIEIANLVDWSTGTIAPAFALSVRPLPLFVQASRDDALENRVAYIASKLQLSIGTTHVGSAATTMASGPTDLAFGVRVTIVDHGDPWANGAFRKALAETMATCAPASPTDSYGPCPAATKKIADYTEDAWNAFRVDVGGATGLRLPESKLAKDDRWRGATGWLVASGGRELGSWIGWAVEARYDARRETSPVIHQLGLGARVFAGAARVHALGELVARVRTTPAGSTTSDHDYTWSLGGELRITTQTWFAVGVGKALEGESGVQVFGNVRVAVSDREHFSRPSKE